MSSEDLYKVHYGRARAHRARCGVALSASLRKRYLTEDAGAVTCQRCARCLELRRPELKVVPFPAQPKSGIDEATRHFEEQLSELLESAKENDGVTAYAIAVVHGNDTCGTTYGAGPEGPVFYLLGALEWLKERVMRGRIEPRAEE